MTTHDMPSSLAHVERAARAALSAEIRTRQAQARLSEMHRQSRLLVGGTVILLGFALVGTLVLLAGAL